MSSMKYQESPAPGLHGTVVHRRPESSLGVSGQAGDFDDSPSSTNLQPGHERTPSQPAHNAPLPRSHSVNSLHRSASQSNMSHKSKSFKAPEQKTEMDITTAELVNYKRLFDTFDTDGSQCLSFDELKYMLLCLGIALDDEAIAELREEFDEDGNGTLDFDEFVQLMQVADLQSKRTISSEDEKRHITQLNSWRFAHNTEWRMTWDTTVLLITFYYALRSIYEMYKQAPLNGGEIVTEVLISAVLLADVGIFSNSAFQDENGKMVDNIKDVMISYARSSLAFDLLGAFPFDLFYIAANPDYSSDTVFLFFRFLRLLRVVRVATTLFLPYSLTGYLTPGFVYFMYHVAPVFRAVFYFVFLVHILTVGWLFVVDDPIRVEYWDALYLVLYTISTVGYGDVFVVGRSQRLYCSMMFILGTMMNGIVISQMSVFLSKADIVTERKDKMRETLAVLSHFDIPKETQSEILSFQNHLLEHNLGSSHESLIAALPRSIQDNLGLFMKIKYISLVPMFASASHECKVALAQFLFNIVFQPQQFIIIAGEEGKEMYFLGHGVADVILPKGNYIATLLKGNFFGEIALLVDGAKRTASIKALTYCDVFRLEKRDFTAILNKFPMFKDSVKIQMEERVAQFQAGQEKAKAAEEEKKKEKVAGKKKATQSPRPAPAPVVSPSSGRGLCGEDEAMSSNGSESSVRKRDGSGLHARPVSGMRKKQSQDKPLIEIKPDLISAVESNNNNPESKGLREDKTMRMSMYGMPNHSHSAFGKDVNVMETSIVEMLPDGSSTEDNSNEDKASRTRRPPPAITTEQRDRARAMAMGFLQGGAPGLVQTTAESTAWQEPTPGGLGPYSRSGPPRSNSTAGMPPRPPTLDQNANDLKALVDRMNRMENYLSEQSEGTESGPPHHVPISHSPPQHSVVHPFDRDSAASNSFIESPSSAAQTISQNQRGMSSSVTGAPRRKVSISVPGGQSATVPTQGSPRHGASSPGFSFGSDAPEGGHSS